MKAEVIMPNAEQLQRILEVLRPLAAQLPKGLRADWQDTDHYELTSQEPNEYFWLDLYDCLSREHHNSDTETGKRAGLLLDLAEAVSKLKDEGLLQ